jgi:hypothetical protein
MGAIGEKGRSGVRRMGLTLGLVAGVVVFLPFAAPTRADWPWSRKVKQSACGHAQCGHGGCCHPRVLAPSGWAGEWYWIRSPDQEQRVVSGLYNRYCIRCHGVDGRGVWDIPDVPDFTDPRWQSSRPDPQIAAIVLEGRGACMPMFRGTLTLEEAYAMARHLRTFVPGTEMSRPDVGRSGSTSSGSTSPTSVPAPSASLPITPPATR